MDQKMIQQILDTLFEQPDFREKKDYAVNVVVRDPLLIKIFFKHDGIYFIKAAAKQISDSASCLSGAIGPANTKNKVSSSGFHKIIREYAALEECSRLYPGLIPVPVIFAESDQYVILVTKNIDHTVTELSDIFSTAGQIQTFLTGRERMVKSMHAVSYNDHVQTLNQALTVLPKYLHQDIQTIRVLHAWDKLLEVLPVIPQHGDLAINNMAQTGTGLILFDWEDYGFVTIPGFDLCILLVSGCNFNLSELILLIENDIHKMNEESFLSPIVHGMGIHTAQLMDLIVMQLVIFYQLKTQLGYGSDVIANTESLLKQLILFVLNKDNNDFEYHLQG
jgi:Phosphotransferase enzyme family